jgi:thermitase
MKKVTFFIAAILLALSVPFSTLSGAEVVPREEGGGSAPGEIIIGFKPDLTEDQINAVVFSIGGEIVGEINLPQSKIRRVRISSTVRSIRDETIRNLRSDPVISDMIKYAEPNVTRKIHQLRGPSGDAGILSQSSDPILSDQWGYYDISANWINVQTVSAPIVAVIDTGVDYTHPDLSGRVIKGRDFVNLDGDPMDDNGHGTHVAGIIAAKANNSYGIAGVSWKSKILAVKVLNFYGVGYEFEIVQGIVYAANYPGVRVINMSLGGAYSSAEQDAVDYAVVKKKKLLVASAGNGGTGVAEYPAGLSATYPGRVLAVAAHGTDHCRASFSNYGTWVSITAPGVDILSTYPPLMGQGDFLLLSGTSMAAPHVSGAAAVAWGKFPALTNQAIGNLLMEKNGGNGSGPDPLVRNGSCWPNDGSTFDRLDILHVLEADAFEDCTLELTSGYAMDGESGEPLTGAKVTAKLGATPLAVDYVPYYGEEPNPYFEYLYTSGFGLFTLSTNLTAEKDLKVAIQKSGFAPVTIPDVHVTPCFLSYAGNIPVPAKKPYYWLAISWNYGYNPGDGAEASYDAYLSVPGYVTPYFFGNPGSLQMAPWVRLFWDDYSEISNLRRFSEVIRIKKLVPGEYTFYVFDEKNGVDSTSWFVSGIKAYIYRWDATHLRPKLAATFTPQAGQGAYWDICTIKGNIITPINTLRN